MDTILPSFEDSVVKRFEGAYLRRRFFAVALFILCPILLLLLLLYLIGPAAVIWYVPMMPSLLAFVIRRVNRRYFSLEYHYRISKGTLTVFEGQNGKKTRLLFEQKINRLTEVARVEAGRPLPAADQIVTAASSRSSPLLHYALVTENGVTTLLYFDAPETMLSLLCRDLPSADKEAS